MKKRNGAALSKKEIDYFVKAYTEDEIPDYQAAALLMAIWFNQMDERETSDLTLAIRDSGDIVDLSAIDGICVDKHSTGGVADTTSLVTLPLVAACGGKIAKISGRGLGHTGGTVDKLESIPGVATTRNMEDFIRIVSKCGMAVIGQSANLVPADKKLYGLRDVTCTVDNLSLISSSIMSKKLASGADAIVLDVKTGNGAFNRGIEEARTLARMMVSIGERAGKSCSSLVTDMNQPLGNAVGNALEVREAIEILAHKCGGDLKTVSFSLAVEMLLSAGLAKEKFEAEQQLHQALLSGKALQCLGNMIELLGGDAKVCSDPSLLPQAAEEIVVSSKNAGYVKEIQTSQIGVCALLLGAGRLTRQDTIDPAVGLWMKTRLGDRVEIGDELARIYVNDKKNLETVVSHLHQAIILGEDFIDPPPLIYN